MSYVVINAITVPPDRAAELEERFASRAGLVSGAPGFEAFELLRPANPEAADRYLVCTWWESKQDFENWTASPAFRHGHRSQGHATPVATGAELWHYEIIQRERAGERSE